MSPRMTSRDRTLYEFMIQCNYLPMKAIDIARLFYLADSRNVSSATTIQNRRCQALVNLGYLDRMKRSFGTQSVYFVSGGTKPNPKTLRHRLLYGSTLAEIATSGFDIDFKSVKVEVPLMDGLRCDLYAEISYNNKKYSIIIEIGTTHPIDEQKYKIFIDKVRNREVTFPYPLLLLNVSDFKMTDEYVKKCITTVKTDFSDFSRFVYNFISD